MKYIVIMSDFKVECKVFLQDRKKNLVGTSSVSDRAYSSAA